MSYILAFSVDGATDVTRRYVRNHALHGSPRQKCPEPVLTHILQEIKRMRRENITDKEERKKMLIEDEREERELKHYVVRSLAAAIGNMIPTGLSPGADEFGGGGYMGGNGRGGGGGGGGGGEAAKMEERQSEEREWREARGQQQAGQETTTTTRGTGNGSGGRMTQGGPPPPGL